MAELGMGTYLTTKCHEVEIDRAGGGYPRLTCHDCNDATLVKQPYMTADIWLEKTSAFQEVHGKLDFDLYKPA